MALGHSIAEAHGCGRRPKVSFDIHDRRLARRQGTFQRWADIGGYLDILAMAAKGADALFLALIA
jgi:hypothetical protein